MQKRQLGIECPLVDFDWQQYYKFCAVVCIKEEAQLKGIVYSNITQLREYEYEHLHKGPELISKDQKQRQHLI